MRRALLMCLFVTVASSAHPAGPRERTGQNPTPAPTAVVEPTPTPVPTPEPGRVSGKVSVAIKDGVIPAEGAIVYLAQVDKEIWPEKKRAISGDAKITMQDKRFQPRVLPVRLEQQISFPNLDPVFHNVFSLSGKNKFDLGLYKDGKSKDFTFPAPGVVRLFCNIHPGMTAFVLVMQNPWFEAARADGTFKLNDIPPGTYSLKVWHEKGGESVQEIVIEAGSATHADFRLDASRYKVVPHKNKFGQDYSKDGY